jgi:hypothetical protein
LIHRTARTGKEKGLRNVTWNSYCEVGRGGSYECVSVCMILWLWTKRRVSLGYN